MEHERPDDANDEAASFAAPETGRGPAAPTPAADLIVEALSVDLPEPEPGLDASEAGSLGPPAGVSVGIGAKDPSGGSVESPVPRESPTPDATDDAAVTWHRLEASQRIRTWSRGLDQRENDLEARLERLEQRMRGLGGDSRSGSADEGGGDFGDHEGDGEGARSREGAS